MFSSGTKLKLPSINPKAIIRSSLDEIIRLPVINEKDEREIKVFKTTYSTDTNQNVYSEKSGILNVITYRSYNNEDLENVHCQWCSTVHKLDDTHGIPLEFVINDDNLITIRTGCYCNDRCMYADALANYDLSVISKTRRFLIMLYSEGIQPAPDRTLHYNFNGPLSHQDFLKETPDITNTIIVYNINATKVYTKYT